MNLRPLSIILALPLLLQACGSQNQGQAQLKDQPESWCHAAFAATDGTKINVDYRLRGPVGRGGYYDVTPLWINVQRDSFARAAAARAVVNSYDRSAVFTQQGDLPRVQESRLSGQVDSVFVLPGRYEGSDVAVVVDGQWLKDPISGTNNFKLDFYHSSRACQYF